MSWERDGYGRNRPVGGGELRLIEALGFVLRRMWRKRRTGRGRGGSLRESGDGLMVREV
jgi:hypothetical protein